MTDPTDFIGMDRPLTAEEGTAIDAALQKAATEIRETDDCERSQGCVSDTHMANLLRSVADLNDALRGATGFEDAIAAIQDARDALEEIEENLE